MVITFENMMRERDFDNLHVQSFFSDLEDFEFKNKRVLELGCGKGNTLIDIKQKFNSNCFGVDLENFVEDKQKDKFSLVEKNLLNISLNDFDKKGFDFIFSFRVFMYLNYVEKLSVLENIYNNLLVFGGIALIDFAGSVNNNAVITSEDKMFLELFKYKNLEKLGFNMILSKKYIFDKNHALKFAKDKNEIRLIKKGIFNDEIVFESFSILIQKNTEKINLFGK